MNSRRKLQEVRCRKCRALLFKGIPVWIEIKCRKCGSIQVFTTTLTEKTRATR